MKKRHTAAIVAIAGILGACATGFTAQEVDQFIARGDCAGAEARMQPYAARGDAAAVNNLGAIAETCRRDRASAVRYYTLAARMGDNTARMNLTRQGEPVPPADLVAQQSNGGSSDAALGLLLLQAARPRPAPQPTNVNCTSTALGNTVRTNCW